MSGRGKVVAAVVAAALGIGVAALASDAMADDGGELGAPTATVRPVPVLGSTTGNALSSAVAAYGVEAFSDPTSSLVLAAWGAAFDDLFTDEAPPAPPDAALIDDPRPLEEASGATFVDPCAGATPDDPTPEGCPEDGEPGEVLGDDEAPPNHVSVFAYPHPDVAQAAECRFSDVQQDEIPIAVITANPGHVEVTFGSQEVETDSDDQERGEWEAWIDDPVGPRPPATLVAHCIAVPLPSSDDPLQIIATATDDHGQVVTAETELIPMDDGLPPATVTPLDGTLVRVDVPVAEGASAPFIGTRTIASFGASPIDCEGIGAVPTPSPWRNGSAADAEVAPAAGERPWLEDAPAIRRITFPVDEGEPTLVCLSRPDVSGPNTVGFVLTPPDARRLSLAVSELDLDEAVDADAIEVRGSFATLGWIPCGGLLPAADADPGTVVPAAEGVLCTSGGDTGAIAAAGGVLDVELTVGDGVHLVRIPLSAVPGGPPVDTYRLPIPAADLVGVLCTEGIDQDGCVQPEGDAVIGELELTATWDEGPIGPAGWQVEPAPT